MAIGFEDGKNPFGLREQIEAIPAFIKGLFKPHKEEERLPKEGYKFIPGTQIQAPIGSELLPMKPLKPKRGEINLEFKEEPKPEVSPKKSKDIERAIEVYGGKDAPAKKYASQFTEATKKFQFFKDNPHLLPAIAHLETSSGRNITRPNNLLNWGINVPGNNEIFARMSVSQVLDRAISGLGKRSKIYERFRTGRPLTDDELMEFARTYEPANASYGPNLINAIRFIEKQV